MPRGRLWGWGGDVGMGLEVLVGDVGGDDVGDGGLACVLVVAEPVPWMVGVKGPQ